MTAAPGLARSRSNSVHGFVEAVSTHEPPATGTAQHRHPKHTNQPQALGGLNRRNAEHRDFGVCRKEPLTDDCQPHRDNSWSTACSVQGHLATDASPRKLSRSAAHAAAT